MKLITTMIGLDTQEVFFRIKKFPHNFKPVFLWLAGITESSKHEAIKLRIICFIQYFDCGAKIVFKVSKDKRSGYRNGSGGSVIV